MLTKTILLSVAIFFVSFNIFILYQSVFGQGAQQTTTQQGALRWIPQDAIVVTKTPDGFFQGNGQTVGGGLTVEGLVVSGVTSGLAYGISKIDNLRNKKNIQNVAGNQVKVIETVEGVNNQTFELMPLKGNEISNKPETQQNHVKDIKNEAIKNASKA